MGRKNPIVVGVDVGGRRKGFHAVALHGDRFINNARFTTPQAIVQWCGIKAPAVVAVDAPCKWSYAGKSRRAERAMSTGGRTVQCFKTPTRKRAQNGEESFYGWLFNGERLYKQLTLHYRLFSGMCRQSGIVAETFPHAVVCSLIGHVVSGRRKATQRRGLLREMGYDVSALRKIDFLDAALCALTAQAIAGGHCRWFGDQQEGFIVVPD